MTRTELRDYRRYRWVRLNRRRGRYNCRKEGWYEQAEAEFRALADMLSGDQRTVFVEYYHNVRSILAIGNQLHYSERTVSRIKRKALLKVLENERK